MQRWQAKVVCGVIMFVLMPICFLLPIRMVSVFRRWGARGQLIIDLLSCFAGGVFLATYLVFMAPAVRVLIETNLMTPYGITYPLPDALIGVGFFMMLTINYIVRAVNDCTTSSNTLKERRAAAAESRRRRTPSGRSRLDSGRSDVFFNDDVSKPAANSSGTEQRTSASEKVPLSDVIECDETLEPISRTANGNGNLRPPSTLLTPQFSRQSTVSESFGIDAFIRNRTNSVSSGVIHRGPGINASLHASIAELASPHTENDSAIVGGGGDSGERTSATRSIIMMLALSVDSVLEGMTIGLKQSVIEVWAIFIGIVVHESVIAFCLGLQLVRVNAGRLTPVVVAATIYTLMNPIGVIIATAVFETADAGEAIDLANGILQALTSGCFIYVIFYEILDGQITENTPLSRIVAVFCGFAFLASFAAIPGSGPYEHQQQHPCFHSDVNNSSDFSAAANFTNETLTSSPGATSLVQSKFT